MNAAREQTSAMESAAVFSAAPVNSASSVASYTYGRALINRIEEYEDWTGEVRQREVFAGATVIPLSGPYTIPYLRAGTYKLNAFVAVVDEAGGREYFGFYDPDGDGVPDVFEVDSDGSTGIDVALYGRSFFKYTMEERVEFARAAAYEVMRGDYAWEPSTLDLVGVTAYFADEDGRATWDYVFYDVHNDIRVVMSWGGFWSGGAFEGYAEWNSDAVNPSLPPDAAGTAGIIADAMADPDVQTFLATHQEAGLEQIMAGAWNNHFGLTAISGRPVWLLRFNGLKQDVGRPLPCGGRESFHSVLTLYKDVITGETVAKSNFPALGITTATPYEEQARTSLAGFVGDDEQVDLVAIDAHIWRDDEDERSGLTTGWSFAYRTVSLGCVRVHPSSGQLWPDSPCPAENARTIAVPFVDSDVAMAIAMAEGGADIYEEFQRVHTKLAGGTSPNLFWEEPEYDGRPVWSVNITAYNEWAEGSPAGEARAYVDIASGEIVFLGTRRYGVGAEADLDIPEAIRLDQNCPNPFNPRTVIPFTLSGPGQVSVEVFDVTGRLVETLVDEWRPAGEQWVEWSPTGFASGVYLYKVRMDGTVQSRQMILLR